MSDFDTQIQIEELQHLAEELITFIDYLDNCGCLTEQDQKDYDDILTRYHY